MFKPVDIKVDFAAKEREILSYWENNKIVEKYLIRNNNSKKRFSFLDGPITANNPMGVHHAWGRTYKDLWQRYFNMKGFAQRFQNGFDCQGLWVEVEVEKDLNLTNKKEIENLVPGDKKKSIAKFVELCKKRVLKYSRIQTEQSKRLGYFMDWNNSYYTMSDENNYMIWHFLKTCHSNGWIYKGVDSVPWCPRCQTAISQHEMLTEDYKELSHETVFIKLPLADRKYPDTYLLIWTTTPWTLPANVALAIGEQIDYVKIKQNQEYLYLAKNQLNKIEGDYIIVQELKGKKLIGWAYEPLFPGVIKESDKDFKNAFKIYPASFVATEDGSGIVHIAVMYGAEDYELGEKVGLPKVHCVNLDGTFNDLAPQWQGRFVKDVEQEII